MIMKGQRGKRAMHVIRAKKGLLAKTHWQHALYGYPTLLIALIREKLQEKMPGITEKFNSKAHYFGYWLGDDKDRIYIYVQKKKLIIDLCISSDNEIALKQQGFKVKPRDNFQCQQGWLTGWHIPHSAGNHDQIVKWLCKAFEENF